MSRTFVCRDCKDDGGDDPCVMTVKASSHRPKHCPFANHEADWQEY